MTTIDYLLYLLLLLLVCGCLWYFFSHRKKDTAAVPYTTLLSEPSEDPQKRQMMMRRKRAVSPEKKRMQEENKEQMFKELVKRAEDLIVKEKLYLKADLKITEVASRLHSNRSYIQQAFIKKGDNFKTYVNRKRIDYALQLMEKHPDFVMNEIAARSGYSHIGTFYRNFKEMVGKTPAQYVIDELKNPTDKN